MKRWFILLVLLLFSCNKENVEPQQAEIEIVYQPPTLYEIPDQPDEWDSLDMSNIHVDTFTVPEDYRPIKDSLSFYRDLNNLTLKYWANSFLTNYTSPVPMPMNQWSGTFTFTPSCIYTAPGPPEAVEWLDLIKMWGCRKFNLTYNAHKNNCMISWRWNPYTSKIEISYYVHRDNGTWFYLGDENMVSVGINVPIFLEVHNSNTFFTVIIGTHGYTIYKESNGLKKFNDGYRSTPWGGGSFTIPYERKVNFTDLFCIFFLTLIKPKKRKHGDKNS